MHFFFYKLNISIYNHASLRIYIFYKYIDIYNSWNDIVLGSRRSTVYEVLISIEYQSKIIHKYMNNFFII